MGSNSAVRKKTVPNAPFFREVGRCLRENIKVTIYVRGGSMRPFLQDGDKILLAPAVSRKLSKGDIALAYTPVGVLLHRIVRMRKKEIWLAGDANSKQLEHVRKDDIIGVVEMAWRKDKMVNINSFPKRVLAFFWYLLRPFRGYILGAYYRLQTNKI